MIVAKAPIATPTQAFKPVETEIFCHIINISPIMPRSDEKIIGLILSNLCMKKYLRSAIIMIEKENMIAEIEVIV